jgi:hypothetical protein
MAITGGHNTTMSKSPRPAGPSARAPTRLEIIVATMMLASVMKISLALRAITGLLEESVLTERCLASVFI